MNSHSIDDALAALRAGKIVLLVDDAAQTSRGYLICPAATCSADDVCLLANHARGIIFAALSERRVRELALPLMAGSTQNSSTQVGGIDLTVSVEARSGVGTGISAKDRATTLNTLASTDNPRVELVTPGHVFPWQAKTGGVLVRSTPAEAAVDLMALSGNLHAAAVCECLGPDGLPSTEPQLKALAAALKLSRIGTNELVRYRLASEQIIETIAETVLPVQNAGVFRAITFRSKLDGTEHLALAKGDLQQRDPATGKQLPILVRVQSEQGFPALLGMRGGRKSIIRALQRIEQEGRGIFIYVRHLRKNLLTNQVRALAAANEPRKTPHAALREFGIGAQILRALGAERISILGTSREIVGLDAFKLEVTDQQPL